MQNEKEHKEKEKEKTNDQKGHGIKSDPGTTNTTDPQEHMEGPVSSLMQKVGDGFDDKDAEEKSKNSKTS